MHDLSLFLGGNKTIFGHLIRLYLQIFSDRRWVVHDNIIMLLLLLLLAAQAGPAFAIPLCATQGTARRAKLRIPLRVGALPQHPFRPRFPGSLVWKSLENPVYGSKVYIPRASKAKMFDFD